MSIVNGKNMSPLVQRTLNRVDPRLVDHGLRVSWLVSKMLDVKGGYSQKERQDICFMAMLHDIGAYKTEEINQMVRFETENIWEHSIYGYLFLKRLSPLEEQAPAILFHHTSACDLAVLNASCRMLAQVVNIADRVDIYTQYRGLDGLDRFLDRAKGGRFDPEIVELFLSTKAQTDLSVMRRRPITFQDIVPEVILTEEEIDIYLKMLIYSIDFRSQHTVTHTITTASISDELARLMGLGAEEALHVHYGALLHDLGKIGIPVEILEFPGKLSAQAMSIMRTHVDITESILGGDVDDVTTKIALRHHEKLDGSGYPKGLRGDALTTGERIVAVADIVSALLGTRSYKGAYSKERTVGILEKQAASGLLDANIVALLTERIDEIVTRVNAECGPVLAIYNSISGEFKEMMLRYANICVE